MKTINVVAIDDFISAHLQGHLVNTTVSDIVKVLGFQPNNDGNSDHKVVNEWTFTADGIPCAVWDYRGSQKDKVYSTYGPAEVFTKLFGKKYEPCK